MELFRVILVITGVLLLGVAFLMGRRKRNTGVYHRAASDAYNSSLNEVSVPLAAPDKKRQSDDAGDSSRASARDSSKASARKSARESARESARGSVSGVAIDAEHPVETSRTSSMVFDADAELTDEEIDAALPSTGDYPIDPVQTEIEISKEIDDLDLDLDVDEVAERDDVVKVTSFASAVKQASGADGFDKNFSEEFETYGEGFGEPVQLENFEEKLVTVHVAAQNDRRFYGSDLKVLFDQHGYTFGRMSIYHCALDGDKVFSVANMVKPGTFDDKQMDSFETPGLTLFMRLPIELDADVAFNFLIREAKGLAEELGGHLRDGNRNPLSEQTIQHMREEIQQYMFRSKRVLQTT